MASVYLLAPTYRDPPLCAHTSAHRSGICVREEVGRPRPPTPFSSPCSRGKAEGALDGVMAMQIQIDIQRGHAQRVGRCLTDIGGRAGDGGEHAVMQGG